MHLRWPHCPLGVGGCRATSQRQHTRDNTRSPLEAGPAGQTAWLAPADLVDVAPPSTGTSSASHTALCARKPLEGSLSKPAIPAFRSLTTKGARVPACRARHPT